MTKIPLPGPVDPDDYPDDYDPDAEAWDSALDWARKGDYKPMIECLRFNPAAPPDPMAVRNFLADVLDGKKKPRHSEKRDAERVAFVDAKGRRLTIEKRHLKQATAIKRVKEMQSKGHRQAEAIEAVAKELGMTSIREKNKLAEWVRNPRREWGLNQRTVEEMFGSLNIKK